MSYCRWSSNDFQCDVYVYQDVSGGWTTHVAANRVTFASPVPEPVDPSDFLEWYARSRKVMDMIESDAERTKIGLPHDGESFNDPTPGACAQRLEDLKALGYLVPQDAIDTLREEERSGILSD